MTDTLARIIFTYRKTVVGLIALLTVIFASGIPRVAFQTNFADLLPTDSATIQTHFEYQDNYGSPLSISLILKVPEGTIYNNQVLNRINKVTQAMETVPGVNKERIFSLTSRKIRSVRTDGKTIFSDPLLPPGKPYPETSEQFKKLRSLVESTPGVVGTWISWDASAVVIQASLIPNQVDYQRAFSKVQEIAAEAEKSGLNAMLLGQPVLTGWIYTFNQEVISILTLSFLIMLVMLAIYSRSLRLVVLAALSSVLSGIWGLGFLGFLGFSLDPLVLVLPMLIMARTLSHSVQMGLRYQEMIASGMERLEAGTALFKKQFAPGALGIITDALGIFVIAVASIPLMHQLAVFAGWWALSVLFTVMVLTPVIITFLGTEGALNSAQKSRSVADNHLVLDFFVDWVGSRRGRVTLWTLLSVTTVVALLLSRQIAVGNVQPGSPLLWPDSDYNQAVAFKNANFVGSDELVIVVEAPGGDVRELELVQAMAELQRRMEARPDVFGSSSYVDMLPGIRRIFSGNNPKSGLLPISTMESGMYTEMMLNGSNPGDFDRFFDRQYQHASIRFFYKDKTAATVENALAFAREEILAVENIYGLPHVFRLAMGSVGLQDAINREVDRAQWIILGALLVIMLTACALVYRSFVLATILVAPLLLTNFIVVAVMVLMDIGLDVNTLPIASVGMGVGIDYGIYLLSRVIEEARADRDKISLIPAVHRAMRTTGSAIYFTATTMIVAVGIWYFLSDLRFQAEMGLLLALIMGINLLGALLIIPLELITFGREAVWRLVSSNPDDALTEPGPATSKGR
ncbi:MAG: MMPL family transporter [Gammaproteobacteria bacterium]|nr:MMPL family transporter [Gammaproteobacteria bacterium]